MSGTIPLSLSQQFDRYGAPLAGGSLYIIQAGTTSTPQNAYQDSALTIALPNPIPLDAAGRLPQFFLADGLIKIRLVDSDGVQQLVADGIQVIGPSSGGGGGGGSVDPTTIFATGDLKPRYGTGTLDGFVRANGRTIGSATSGASERANADCQMLFEYLWATDPNLTVSGGRGGSASADWSANKTIALPDWSGCVIAGLDDMGAGARGVLTEAYFGTDTTVLGAKGGFQSVAPTADMLPPHTHSGTTDGIGPHRHFEFSPSNTGSGSAPDLSPTNFPQWQTNFGDDQTYTMRGSGQDATLGLSSAAGGDSGRNFTTNNGNGLSGTPFTNVQPAVLATIYIKL